MAVNKRVNYDVIVSAMAGDEDAIAYIIAFFIPRIEARIRRKAYWLSRESQEDCVQEICMGLTKELRKGAFTI